MEELFKPAPEPKTPLGRYRVLSSTAGIRVSPLQLGAMSIGSAWEGFMGSMSKEDSMKLLDAFVDAGGNFIDTANNYQNEESETWIGEWMQSRKNRDSMVIATKFTTGYTSYKVGQGQKAVNSCGNHKRSLQMSLRDSLKKLQTDFVDILYLHWWDYSAGIREVMDSLDALVKQGKVLYLGISDTPAWIVSAANEYAIAYGKTPFSIYQGRWNVMIRDFERDIIPMARHYGMALAPWDAIGGGKFQSKKAVAEREKSGEGMRTLVGKGQTPDEVKASEVLCKIGEKHGVESPTAIALAYVMSKTTNVFPIVGGRKVEHLHDNIKALSIKLSSEEIAELDAVKPFDIGFPMNFVGDDPRVTGDAAPLVKTNALIDYVPAPKPIGHS